MTDKSKGIIGNITPAMIAEGCRELQSALGELPYRRDEPNLSASEIVENILWAALDGYAVIPMKEYGEIEEAAREHTNCAIRLEDARDDYDYS